MELVWAFQALLAVLFGVIAFLYKDLKTKTENNQTAFLNYKTHVSEVYATQPQLTRAIDAVNKTVEQMAASLIRIENRLYETRSPTP